MCNHQDALRNFRRVSSIFVSSTGVAGACLCEYVCGEKWFLSIKNMGSGRFFGGRRSGEGRGRRKKKKKNGGAKDEEKRRGVGGEGKRKKKTGRRK